MDKFEMQTNVEVDLDKVSEFIHRDDFARYLLSETEDFTVAAYILQALLDRVNQDAQTLDNDK